MPDICTMDTDKVSHHGHRGYINYLADYEKNHTTPQPRQPARIAGGAEPTFWGRDHHVFCPIFGGERGLRGCKRYGQLEKR